MKVQVRRIDAASMAEIGALHRAMDAGDHASAWRIEELGDPEPDIASRVGGDRWLCLGIGVLAAVTGFGFMGRLGGDVRPGDEPAASSAVTDRGPSPSALSTVEAVPTTAAFTLLGPDEAATIGRPVVDVHGVASRPLGTLHVAVLVGHVVLGATDVEVAKSGPVDAAIPVFAPPVGVEVELVASVDGLNGRGFDAVRRSLWLDVGGPLGLWPARVLRSRGHPVVVVSGQAPLAFGRVTALVATRAGATLGTARADVRVDPKRSGSAGGYALGLGSFEATVALPDTVKTGSFVVTVDWRDVVSGDWGSDVQTVVVRGPPRSHRR